MTTLDDLDLMDATTPANPAAPKPRKCYRHDWQQGYYDEVPKCSRCPAVKDPVKTKRNRNNKQRGTSDEVTVASLLGGRKVGPMGWPWDVEVADGGYIRAQCKKLQDWPSLNEIIRWLDAIPAGEHMRAVTLADAPGAGRRTRRYIVIPLDEFARWHGKAE